MHACIHAWMYGCMDVWMYGCMDVCMYNPWAHLSRSRGGIYFIAVVLYRQRLFYCDYIYIYIYRLLSSCYVVVLVFFARPVLSTGKFETTVLIKCACVCVHIYIYIHMYVFIT